MVRLCAHNSSLDLFSKAAFVIISKKVWANKNKILLAFLEKTLNQRTIGPENAHLKPDLGAFIHHEMTLTLNTHTPLLTSYIVCICKVSGLRL